MTGALSTMNTLGWKPFFQQQIQSDEIDAVVPARVSAVHKGSVCLFHEHGDVEIQREFLRKLPEVTVGDWVLLDRTLELPLRLLERSSLIRRRAAGVESRVQLIAANVDVLLIVTSCNQDFNLSRLERYLALAHESGVLPVVVLTKVDLCEDPGIYLEQLYSLGSGLQVEQVNALDTATLVPLEMLCSLGTTLAMVGSSGVGKSTLARAFGVEGQLTAPIREDDAKGRHTTTARTLHRIINGSLLIDMPGMREVRLSGGDGNLDEVFDEFRSLGQCRFADCTHTREPGCTLLEAVETGKLSQRRLDSYHKLLREQLHNAESIAQRHERLRKQGKLYKSVQSGKKRERNMERNKD